MPAAGSGSIGAAWKTSSQAYAREIAERWNVRESGVGFVTRFAVRKAFHFLDLRGLLVRWLALGGRRGQLRLGRGDLRSARRPPGRSGRRRCPDDRRAWSPGVSALPQPSAAPRERQAPPSGSNRLGLGRSPLSHDASGTLLRPLRTPPRAPRSPNREPDPADPGRLRWRSGRAGCLDSAPLRLGPGA